MTNELEVSTMSDVSKRPVLAPRTYRWVDRVTKLAGVLLVALGFEAGGHTFTGVALGVIGATLALSTIFVEPATASTTDSIPTPNNE